MIHLRSVRIVRDQFPTEDAYPFNLEVVRRTRQLTFENSLIFFAGENGSGKSTFLRAICRACDIHIWEAERRRRCVRNPHADRLSQCLELSWIDGRVPGGWFASEIFRTFAEALDEFAVADPGILKYFGGRSLLTQSHGQSLMSYFSSRFSREGLYLLDEPETALSPRSQLKLRQLLSEAEGSSAQFIIATHSPILLSCPQATILGFDGASVRQVDFEETGSYRAYSAFFRDMGRGRAG